MHACSVTPRARSLQQLEFKIVYFLFHLLSLYLLFMLLRLLSIALPPPCHFSPLFSLLYMAVTLSIGSLATDKFILSHAPFLISTISLLISPFYSISLASLPLILTSLPSLSFSYTADEYSLSLSICAVLLLSINNKLLIHRQCHVKSLLESHDCWLLMFTFSNRMKETTTSDIKTFQVCRILSPIITVMVIRWGKVVNFEYWFGINVVCC